jgi:protein MPE1
MPMNALPNAARREKNIGTGLAQKKQEVDTANGQNNPPGLTGGESEEDMIAAMFQAQSEQWNKTQEQLATYVNLL